MEGTLNLNKSTVRFCKDSLKTVLFNVPASHSAILATQDGHLVAYRSLKDELDADAIAAMSSTVLNIADVLSAVGIDSESGDSNDVVGDSNANKFALVHAGELIMCLLGDRAMNIGRALQVCKREGAIIGDSYKVRTQ